jgi:hypothetical protein
MYPNTLRWILAGYRELARGTLSNELPGMFNSGAKQNFVRALLRCKSNNRLPDTPHGRSLSGTGKDRPTFAFP